MAQSVNKHTLVLRDLIRKCPECLRRYSNVAIFCPFDGAQLADAQRPDDKLDPLIGQTIDGRYAIESVVGEGGMGTVYRAQHVVLGRALALKVLRADLAQDAELAARFLQEAQATAAIKHPNIVAIMDFGRLPDGRPYFVMELLMGRTLAALISAGGALPPRTAASVARAIAEGLEAAHAAGVVHRDLKPENVFLADGEGKEVRIVDFGAALIVGASRLTKQGVVFGTPFYMSPEQAAGKHVDHRADIYALGIILYEMLTGRVPFEGDTYMGVLTQHMFVAPKPPSEAVKDLDGKLGAIEAVVLRALEKDPSARYQTMHEVGEAIERALESRGAGPSWPSPRPSRPAPRGIADELELPTLHEIRERISMTEGAHKSHRPWVSIVVAGVVVIVGCFAFVLVWLRTSSSPNPTATDVPTATASSLTLVTAATALAATAPSIQSVTAPTESVAPPPRVKTIEPSVRPPKPQNSHAEPTKPVVNVLGPDPFEQH